MYQSQPPSAGLRSRHTAACEAISSWNGAAGSGASTGRSPTRRIASGVRPEYPSAPTGQIARPIWSCTVRRVPE